MKNKPLVSILMNCFNGEKYLKEAINSIVNQSYQNWELIFWDNQSKDNSAKIFLEYEDPRLSYYISSSHTPLGTARNEALKKAKGDWVGIIDTDDIWEKNKLEKQINALNESNYDNLTIGLIYSRVAAMNEKSEILNEICHIDFKKKLMPQGRILEDLLLKGNFIISPSILLNYNFLNSIGGFPKNLRHAPDYYTSCGISNLSNVICVEEILSRYRIHKENLTNKQKVISFEEQIRIFNEWSKVTKISTRQKKKRLIELYTYLGLMIIKYEFNLVKGIYKIFKNGSFLFCVKICSFELIKKIRLKKLRFNSNEF